jgi:hypothetical protein
LLLGLLVLRVFFLFYLEFQHFLKLLSGFWVSHFHLCHEFAERDPATLLSDPALGLALI